MDRDFQPKLMMQSQMRKFNPGLLQTDDEVAAQFVVRHNEFQSVCEVVRGNIESPSCQHVLVVGSRGQGKTMLLTRVAAEVRMDRELSQHFMPIQFMEENQEVDSIADFWMETLFHFAREIASENGDLAYELTEKHSSLMTRWREQGFEELARLAVLEATDRINRRLVILVENVQSLFADVDEDFGWGLRAILQSMPQITLVASATSRFQALDDPKTPFFGLFRCIHLNPLTTQECGRLWSIVSEKESVNPEIRPLEILTGGNPRLIVVVASFAQHRSLRQLMEELVVLVDEHSDYFRTHLEILPKQERRVFVALVDLWQASSASEVAARARIDIRVVSTMLNRLITRGAVSIVDGDGIRKRLYVATERLYSIYYKLRRENSEASVVESLIQFMVCFYDVKEVYILSDQLYADALKYSSIHAGIERALATRIQSDEVGMRFKWDELARALAKVNEKKQLNAGGYSIVEILRARDEENWQAVLDLSDRYMPKRPHGTKLTLDQDSDWGLVLLARSDAFLALERYDDVIGLGEEIERKVDETNELNFLLCYSYLKFNQALAHTRNGDLSLAQTACEKIVQWLAEFDKPHAVLLSALAYLLRAEAEIGLGSIATALSSLDTVLTKFGERDLELIQDSIARAMFRKGEILGSMTGDFAQSNRTFEEFTERFKSAEDESIRNDLVSAKINQAMNCAMLGEFERELNHFEEVVDSFLMSDGARQTGHFLFALRLMGRRLAELGRHSEALAICDDAENWLNSHPKVPLDIRKITLDWHITCTRALALMSSGNPDAVLGALRRAYDAFDTEQNAALEEIMRLIVELIAAGANEQDLIAVLQRDESISQAVLPLIVALQRRTAVAVRAPVEVIEVAADIEQCIHDRLKNGLQPGYFLNLAYE